MVEIYCYFINFIKCKGGKVYDCGVILFVIICSLLNFFVVVFWNFKFEYYILKDVYNYFINNKLKMIFEFLIELMGKLWYIYLILILVWIFKGNEEW